VSDVSQGPGWWIASDGKWYPPESHPDRAVVPPPEPEPEPVSPPKPASFPSASPDALTPAASEPTPDSAPEAPTPPPAPASRWLGRDRPTASAPAADLERTPDDPPPVSSIAPGSSPPLVPAARVPDEAPLPAPAARRTGSKKLWVVAVVVLVALAVAAVAVALGSKSASILPTGAETATIHITLPPTGKPSFSGSVGGLALTGTVTGSGVSSSSGGVLFNYKGSLGGTAYVLHVSLDTGNNGSSLQGSPLQIGTFRVTGTYGSEPVSATAVFEEPSSVNARSPSVPVMVSGSFGDQFVDGTATATEDPDGAFNVKANLTVLPAEPNSPTLSD
jgi:hypothetical protein